MVISLFLIPYSLFELMPITTSAKQSLRKDRRRTTVNTRRKRRTKRAIDQFKTQPTEKNIQKAISQIDKMVKWQLYSKNKAAHLKSQLSKLATASKQISK
jgi:ribosomal protein S20